MRARLLTETLAADAAMTISQTLEMRLTGRPPSDFPVLILEALLGRPVPDGRRRAVAGRVVQTSFVALVVVLARAVGRQPTAASAAAGGALLVAADSVLATTLGLAPPLWRWSRRDLSVDLLHKTVLVHAAQRATRPNDR